MSDTLRAANEHSGRPVFDVQWLSASKASVPVWGGQSLQPTGLLSPRSAPEVCVIPGLWATPARPVEALEQRETIDALTRLPAQTRLWSYCAGVTLLAAAKRLERRAATATWWLQPALEARFPGVSWRFSDAVVRDGPIVTASGANGWLPLLDTLLRQTVGPAATAEISDFLLVPQARNRHPLFRQLDVLSTNEALLPLRAWVLKTDATQLRLPAAAKRLGLSTRTLSRRVLELTGKTAAEWVRQVKLKQAADLLIRTAKSAKEISFECGFSSEASFHRTFRRTVGQTPLTFRRSYAELLLLPRV